jgi:hypothetical protein
MSRADFEDSDDTEVFTSPFRASAAFPTDSVNPLLTKSVGTGERDSGVRFRVVPSSVVDFASFGTTARTMGDPVTENMGVSIPRRNGAGAL